MSNPTRVSQRIPLSCQNCAQQKIRCDKRLPCSRCQKRGLVCHRQRVVRRVRDQEDVESHDLPDYAPAPVEYSARRNQVASRGSALQYGSLSIAEPRGFSDDLATSIEGLAWGRRVHMRFHHRGREQRPQPTHTVSITTLPQSISRILPSASRGRFLVRFHLQHLSWNHNVIHGPRFLDQCNLFFESGEVEDIQWLALYFSLLSVSEWTLENARHHPHQTSTTDPVAHHSAIDYFDAMLEVLHYARYMEQPSICAVQAIIVSEMVAHVIGKSVVLQTMLHSCIRIAQILGLHQEDHTVVDTIDPARMAVEREVARGVWWKLVQLDYFSIPYTNSYSINVKHFTTSMPSNSDDQSLDLVDAGRVTKTTFTIVMSKIALLLPDLLDGLCSSTSIEKKYELVLDVDRRMRAVVQSIPSRLLRSQSPGSSITESEETSWIQLARRTLAITAADKILMIHRPFLLMSFRSSAYRFTKNTCIAAATTILREHQNIVEAQGTTGLYPIWAHSAFCNAAVIVLGLHILYGDPPPSTREQHIGLILAARERLLMQRSDTMAKKGVHLIEAMLEQPQALPEQIFERFWTLESLAQGDLRSVENGEAMESPAENSIMPPNFTTWFNDVFGCDEPTLY